MAVRKVGKNTYRTGKDKGPKLEAGDTASRKIRRDGGEAPWRVNKHHNRLTGQAGKASRALKAKAKSY